MKVLASLQKGICLASRHWRAMLVVYFFNLALAGAVALPVFQAIDAGLSHTESARPMAEGFDWLWLDEFRSSRDSDGELSTSVAAWQQGLTVLLVNFSRYVRGSLRSDLPSPLIWMGILYLLITTFLTGGILGLFAEQDARFSLRFFFDRAGRYFTILLGILVVAAIIYWLLWDVLGASWQQLVAGLRREATTEWTPVLLDWLGVLVLVAAAFFVHMVMDYARIASVAWEKLGLFPVVVGASFFCLRNLRKTLGLFYATTLLAALIALSYGLLIKLGGGASTVRLIVMAVVQQGFILASIWIRMVYLGGQISFYRSMTDTPVWATPAGPRPDVPDDHVAIEQGDFPAGQPGSESQE